MYSEKLDLASLELPPHTTGVDKSVLEAGPKVCCTNLFEKEKRICLTL